MSLNIKNPEAVAALRELAAATGETLTEALTRVAREDLARHRRLADRERRIARIRQITAEMRELIGDEPLDFESLYDAETGLPA